MRAKRMTASKLEKYLNILEALVDRPMRASEITRKAHVEPQAFKRLIRFLMSNEVVQERSANRKQVVYALTERGLAVFKTLRALQYLEKLKASLPVVEEAREIVSMLSKQQKDWQND